VVLGLTELFYIHPTALAEACCEALTDTCRAPVDVTTLQPGRRVSKAGLESLRPFAKTEDGSLHDDGDSERRDKEMQ
jgi:hypothetical protein